MSYLHGYDGTEQARLRAQARFLAPHVYAGCDAIFAALPDACILEVGCGVGAQTEILLERYPQSRVVAVDIEPAQIQAAEKWAQQNPQLARRCLFLCLNEKVHLRDAVVRAADERGWRCNSAFVCWVLEHVADPQRILHGIQQVLPSNSPVVVTEVMNQTLHLHPAQPQFLDYWQRYNRLQIELGGDPFVGTRLGDLLGAAGYQRATLRIEPLVGDRRDPDAKRALLAYWSALAESGRPQLLSHQRLDGLPPDVVTRTFAQLQNDDDSTFFYAFAQMTAYT